MPLLSRFIGRQRVPLLSACDAASEIRLMCFLGNCFMGINVAKSHNIYSLYKISVCTKCPNYLCHMKIWKIRQFQRTYSPKPQRDCSYQNLMTLLATVALRWYIDCENLTF